MEIDYDLFKKISREIPSNIFFKDTECRYVFATHYWRHLNRDGDSSWDIAGKTDLDIRKDKENALLAMEQDKEILKTGKGVSYVIEVNQDGYTEYLELIKNPVRDDDGKIIGIVGLINDVTEKVKLEKELENYARTDLLTGLFNRHYLEYWLVNSLNTGLYPLCVISADWCAKYVASMQEMSKSMQLKGNSLSVSFGFCEVDGPNMSISCAMEIADKRMHMDKNEHHASR